MSTALPRKVRRIARVYAGGGDGVRIRLRVIEGHGSGLGFE
jgi:hypothetical protein